uniref:non-specific serine/threonine protein kinase n=1 Tax=Aceria tosichella TaxID=561515 RepID=A0A6G1SK96_9ACAR
MSCKIDFVNDWELRHQGAESRLYFGLHSNNRCVIKHRFSKKYRHQLLDKKLTKERTKRERKMIERIHSKSQELGPYMPKVIWSNEDTIIMTEITQCETLYDYIERESPSSTRVIDIAPLIGRCIAELHNIGIIHGDLTTANLILVPKTPKSPSTEGAAPSKRSKQDSMEESLIVIPIDFGLSTGSEHPEEKSVDLYVLERALLSTHFADSKFFNCILDAYMERLTCDQASKQKVLERFKEVRMRGRKQDYSDDMEA